MKEEDHYRTIHFSTAEEAYKVLDPTNSLWQSAAGSRWLYRGQGDATWELKPYAWREDGRKKLQQLRQRSLDQAQRAARTILLKYNTRPEDRPDWAARLTELISDTLAEFEAIRVFVEIADDLGLHIRDFISPAQLSHIQANPLRYMQPEHSQEPFRPTYAQALAQHHGVPTRLMDFSRDSRKAVYFAAEFALANAQKAINPEATHFALYAIEEKTIQRSHGLAKFRVPRDQFRFVTAQDGLFIFACGGPDLMNTHSGWPNLLQVLQASNALFPSMKPITKLVLPATQAEPLLRLLHANNITATHLRPSYESIVQLMATEWQWDLYR